MGKERKPGEFDICGDVVGSAGKCDDGKPHYCCLSFPHDGNPCLCGKCGQTFL